ncbi:related to bZIP transcription factor [Rhynchosporium agropyri]|uniref:Related to bZIP transcription factor n=1 Tax=Rhynchosporium agropyri TaxID=914238 RepID=A0A1E1KC26_9HELO|nr:related to bZIP transcription factor [Rhynchosporium agropyri]
MSTQSKQSSSMSQSTSQASCHDPLDSMVDFSEYDKLSYQSPSNSPSAIKTQFTSRAVSNTPATLPSSSHSDLSGPSHNYGMYKQQTGIPQGAVASTLAVNQMSQFNGLPDSYLSGYNRRDEFVDFGTAPSQTAFADMDMEFDSPKPEPAFFYPEASPEFINPQSIATPAVLPAETSNVGRLWPGMHQQQAVAKAQAQQKQQQQMIQHQRQSSVVGQQKQRPRRSQVPDPIVEEKISQLLNSMRHSSVGSDETSNNGNMSHAQRARKDEEEMDEDERLLASEEGKKLSSKERRQLRNKVSARAFRSRRKEYIGQLEGEIAVKVNENTDLRTQNRALMEENTRLSDLTRMLLSSPSFSGFLDTLASNPAAAQTAQAAIQPQQTLQVEQPQQRVRKDLSPYAAPPQQMRQQHIGMTMIPEQTMDYSMLDLTGTYSYQPQVFSVPSLPETFIDTETLSGKNSSFCSPKSDSEKIELPKIERMPAPEPEKIEASVVVDTEFDSDPAFALYSAPVPASLSAPEEELDLSFLANLSTKQPQYELVTEAGDAASEAALRRVDKLVRDMDACAERLMSLTMHL